MKTAIFCIAICIAAAAMAADQPLPGTLTTNMAARLMPGIWYRGVLIQGPMQNTAGKADLLRFSRGGLISSSWYETFDANHGWIVFWFRPEWNGADGKERCLLQWSQNGFIKKTAANELVFSSAAGVSVSTNISNWQAGETYRIDAAWNSLNSITGSYRLMLAVNQTNVFGVTANYTPEAPEEYIHVGSSLQTNCAANGIIAGLTIFRRYNPNALYTRATSSGHNIASWDMTFGLPTSNDGTDAFFGGATHAFTHPYTNSSLLPGNSRMGGYMLAGNYATDGWSLEGAPTAAAMTAAQKIYRGGYQTTSTAANQGLYQDIPVTPGTSMVICVVAHSDGVAIPRAIFYNQTAGNVIGQLTGRAASTRFNPDLLIFTCEAPAGCAVIRVKLVNTQASGTVYWHQAEVLNNRIITPSVETGAPHSSGSWLPTGWSCNFDTAEAFQELANVHSGNSAVRVARTGGGFEGYTAPVSGAATFNSFGWWGSRQGGYYHTNTRPCWNSTAYTEQWWLLDSNSNYWHSAYVCYSASSVAIARSSGGSTAFTDDVYFFPLRSITLFATPASPADSVEGAAGIRVDGRDVFYGAYPGLGLSSGSLAWQYAPRHSASCAIEFGHPAVSELPGGSWPQAYVLTAWGNSDNFIRLYWVTNDVMRLRYRMNGSESFGDWRGTGIESGKRYRMQLSYKGGETMMLSAQAEDCAPSFTPAINLSPIPAAFAVAPATVYWGVKWDGVNATNQGDAVFERWPRGTVIRIF